MTREAPQSLSAEAKKVFCRLPNLTVPEESKLQRGGLTAEDRETLGQARLFISKAILISEPNDHELNSFEKLTPQVKSILSAKGITL